METLLELLEDEIKDIYNAENQLTKALPKMAKKAASESLADAFAAHLEETKRQIERLQKIGDLMGIKLTGKKCKAMEGLIEEGKEVLEEDGKSAVIDAALIGAAQRVEHYEIAAYGTAKAMAEHLGLEKVVKLLQQTLSEESACDEKLSSIALEEVLPATDGVEEEIEEKEVAPLKAKRKKTVAR
ncbi:ferritin-like domain-containing protein [Anatilimnocola floriformis]|uniref:ferritin-like domain-containing protein n=1 Tax=Anatilimnocola floriformis TaxID=2948575 RepID=UPI0020C59C58|nr:ferritin-like domain-containing protein [Anatilimnocola floriformis]